MADVEFSDEIRDRILYHWSELGDRPRLIWRRLQDEGFNVDWNTVEALMQCEQSDDESAETLAERYEEDNRSGGGGGSSGPVEDDSLSTSGGGDIDGRQATKKQKTRDNSREKAVATPPNRRTKLTPDVLSLIEKILDTDGSIYSLAALQGALAAKGVKISKTTTFRALEKLGRSIVVKKMICSNSRSGPEPVPLNLQKEQPRGFAARHSAQHENINKRRIRALTIREMEAAAAGGQHFQHQPQPVDQRIAVPPASVSPPSNNRGGVTTPGSEGQGRNFPPVASGRRIEGDAANQGSGGSASLVLPPKKAVTAASLNLVLGHGGVTSYTSAPINVETVKDKEREDDNRPQSKDEEMDHQEIPSNESSSSGHIPTVKKEIVDDDFEVKVDECYDMGDDEVEDDRRSEHTSSKRLSDRDGTESSTPRSEDGKVGKKVREKLPVPMRPWMDRTDQDDEEDDDEAAILEAREIARRRLSHPDDQAMLGSEDDIDSEQDMPENLKRPESHGRSSVGSAQSAGSRGSHSSHGPLRDETAKSGRSSSTLTSHSGSSSGSGGMDRCQRSPLENAGTAATAATAAAMAAAGMRYPGPQFTFHRSQMCNAAAMASRLAAAHGLPPDMGGSVHVGQRRLPLSAGRGGVKQPFMSKYQRNLAGARQAMASGMPRRMQKMAAAAAAAAGFPPGIPPHKMHKMMRMRHHMAKGVWGMHHGGHGHSHVGGGGRFAGDFPGRHMRNRHLAAAYTAAAHGQAHTGAEDVSPELEIDPPETYGEFAERIFASSRNQRSSESPPENADVRKWLENISHRMSVIEGQLQIVIDHLPFIGGTDIHSISSDAGGGGSEVDSGLQEDSVPGSGGGNDSGGGSNGGSGGPGGGAGASGSAGSGSDANRSREDASDGGTDKSAEKGGDAEADNENREDSGGTSKRDEGRDEERESGTTERETREEREERGKEHRDISRVSRTSQRDPVVARDRDRDMERPTFPYGRKSRPFGPGWRSRMDVMMRGHKNGRGRRLGSSSLGGDHRQLRMSAPMDDSYRDDLDDTGADHFDESMSDITEQSYGGQSQMGARIEMVIQDPRWSEMTPYAGAPRLAIALARYCIFGTKILVRSSVTGRNQKSPLDFAGMRRIKQLLLQKYGARCSPIEFEVIWKTSRESISQLCKRLRRKYGASSIGQQEDFMIDCPLLT